MNLQVPKPPKVCKHKSPKPIITAIKAIISQTFGGPGRGCRTKGLRVQVPKDEKTSLDTDYLGGPPTCNSEY